MSERSVDLPIDESYVAEAAAPEAIDDVRTRLPGLLDRLGKRSRIVRLAQEAYGYATDPVVPKKYKILGIATLLYLLNPFDAIPDVLPGVGYIDDAAALAAFLVAVRKVVGVVRDAAKDVVTHAAAETHATLATRGLAQLALSLWTATLAASIGLIYAGARALIAGNDVGVVSDPFAIACLVTAFFGLAATADTGRRAYALYTSFPPARRDRFVHAVAAQVTGRRLAVLVAPIVALAFVVGARLALSMAGGH